SNVGSRPISTPVSTSASVPTATSATSVPEPTPNTPPSYKIEYLPWHTDLQTFGGRDLERIDRELAPRVAAQSQPRGVQELGTVDIYSLIMSLESRLSFEVSYAINTLLILSAGVDASPHFQLPLAQCDNLLDVLLDVLIENAFESTAAELEQ